MVQTRAQIHRQDSGWQATIVPSQASLLLRPLQSLYIRARIIAIASGIVALSWLKKEEERRLRKTIVLPADRFATLAPDAIHLSNVARCGRSRGQTLDAYKRLTPTLAEISAYTTPNTFPLEPPCMFASLLCIIPMHNREYYCTPWYIFSILFEAQMRCLLFSAIQHAWLQLKRAHCL